MRYPLRKVVVVGLVGLVTLIATTSFQGCYIAQQGYFQVELLAGRKPIDQVIASGTLTEAQVEKLKLVHKIKDYGQTIGLSATDNYETINPDWKRTIWNVSACEPLTFHSRTWKFPIVGTVPYLGYFREEDAQKKRNQLERDGYDVYVRTAGAYSTLGWFRDPILPDMLNWSEYNLADTVLHELAHATLWVPGSVSFNESFANFVGEEAAMQYLIAQYGDTGAPVTDAIHRLEDAALFRKMMHDTYLELEALYTDPSLDDFEKQVHKHAILASLPTRTAKLGLHREKAYLRSVQEGVWNNARLLQYRTYNQSHDWFDQLLKQENGDLLAFIRRIGEITKGADDPYLALAQSLGIDPAVEPQP